MKSDVAAALRGHPRGAIWSLGLLVLAALALRLVFLNRPLLWDEGTTLFRFVQQPIWVTLSWYPNPNNHVLYSALANVAGSIAGHGLWTLRLPALVAGILLVPAVYFLGCRLYDRGSALAAAAFVSVWSPLVGYSVNGRGYTLLAFLFLVLSILALYLKRTDNAAGWVAFTALGSLGMYTVPVMVYPLAMLAAWLLLMALAKECCLTTGRMLRRITVVVLGTIGLTFLLYLPVLLVSGPARLFSNPYVRSIDTEVWSERLVREAPDTWAEWNVNLHPALVVALVLGLLMSLMLHRRIAGQRVPLVAGLATAIFLVAIQQVVPPPRVWLFVLPIYLLMSLAAWQEVLRWLVPRPHLRRVLWGAMVSVVTIWTAFGTFRAEFLISRGLETETLREAPQVAAFLKTALRSGDAVLYRPPSSRALLYEMQAAGLVDKVARDATEARRVLVVVNTLRGQQTVESALQSGGISASMYEQPRLIRQWDHASDYEVLLR
jgi:hypothetical protein